MMNNGQRQQISEKLLRGSAIVQSKHALACPVRLAEVTFLPSRHPKRQEAVRSAKCNCHLSIVQENRGAVYFAGAR
jgi:hypothetical protein